MSFRIESAIDHQSRLLIFQLICVGILLLSLLGVWVIELFFPDFFNYPYLNWGGWKSVLNFWPLLLWGATATLVLNLFASSDWPIRASENQQILTLGVMTSILAGIWEEIGYRWLFICFSMVSISVLNWIFGVGLGWIIATVCSIGCLYLFSQKEIFIGIIVLVIAVLAAAVALYADPVLFLYKILVWIIHYTTFGLMDSVLYGSHDTLFVFGAIAANTLFRDGHKYQGPLGIVNSWYCGMAMLYAMMTYGLWTAVVIHVLYNITIDIVRFVLQRTR